MEEVSLFEAQQNQTQVMNKGDVLNYKGFEYKTYEWDNVPHIMPRLAFHLEAYIKGLVKLCSEYDERETV